MPKYDNKIPTYKVDYSPRVWYNMKLQDGMIPQVFVRIKEGWYEAGKIGMAVGPIVLVNGMYWQGVIWDDADDPEFFKLDGLDFLGSRN